MDRTDYFQYPERVITHNGFELFIRDINNKEIPIRYIINALFIRQVKDDLFLFIKTGDLDNEYEIVLLNDKLKIINTSKIWCDDVIYDVYVLFISEDLIILHLNNFSTHRYVINSFGNERLPIFDGTTVALFQFKNQIVSYHQKGYGPRHFQVIDIDYLEECVEFYQSLTDQIKGVEKMMKVDENEETFTICAVCQEGTGKMIRIVNSKGKLLFYTGCYSDVKFAYDVYDKKIVCYIKLMDRVTDSFMDIYKKDDEWLCHTHRMNHPIDKFFKLDNIIISRSKILFKTNSIYDIVMEKENRKIEYDTDTNGLKLGIYYDFYDKWLNNKLERLLREDVLKSLNRNLLLIILSYVS